MAEHRMLYEIKEQPDVIRRLVAGKNDPVVWKTAYAIMETRDQQGNIYLVGNGSSYHACIYGQFILSVRSRLTIDLYDTSEFADYTSNLTEKDIVIIVSQSGETGDAIRLLPKIKSQKPKIIAITNYPQSTLGQSADIVVPMQLGDCLAIPNTKGYTAAMSIFGLLAEKVRGDEDFSFSSSRITYEINRIITGEYERIRVLADKLRDSTNLFVLGHASGLSNAYEGALKIKECSHLEAEGYSALEFRHGPSSVVTTGTPVIVFMADYESETDLGKILEEISQPDPYVLGIGSVQHKQFDEQFEVFEHSLYAAVPAIVPIQILAFELALARGIDPEQPSGVQRVVL